MAEEVAQEIVDIIVENASKDDNTILGEIIGAGIPFNKARGVLNQVLVDQGLKMTKEQRDEKAAEMLEGWEVSEDTTVQEVDDMVEDLAQALKSTAKQVKGYIKAVFTEADLTMPKATKAKRTRTPGFHGDAKITSDFLLENPETTKEEFIAFMKEQGIAESKGGQDKTARFWNFMIEIKTFATAWCEAGNCK